MSDWKQGLDRYLTTPPEDGFDLWFEHVVEALSDEFYKNNIDFIESQEFVDILDKYFNEDRLPVEVAEYIEEDYASR